jgi:hypothetical protein
MIQDSYRLLAKDIMAAVKLHVELVGGPYEDAAAAHVRQWQKRLDALDRECSTILRGSDGEYRMHADIRRDIVTDALRQEEL